MNKVVVLVSLLCCAFFTQPVWAQDQDSTETEMELEPGMEVDVFTAMPDSFLLNARQLKREKWFYSLDEAFREPMKVYKLSLNGSKLKEFPRDLSRFPNLQILDLSNNRIKYIPPSIVDLPHLQSLRLYHNKIKALPDELRYLEHLETIYLARNKLVEIPAWVGGLSKLRTLDLAYNNLTPYELIRIQEMIPNCEVTH